MVSFEEIQSAYYMVAATGVLVAAVYYVLNIQSNRKNQELMLKAQQQTLETRQADILQRQAQIYTTRGFMDAWVDVVFHQSYLTYEEWREGYGPRPNPDAYANNAIVIQYYETLGGLLREGFVSMELVENIWHPIHLICVWERVEPLIKGWRRTYHDDSMYRNLEYLYERFMERHPEALEGRSVLHTQKLGWYDEDKNR